MLASAALNNYDGKNFMDYAVIQTGGKQYRVQQDDVIEIEKLDAEEGSSVDFDVLAISRGGELDVGAPTLTGKVTGEIVGQFRGPKVYNFKKKRRKGYVRKVGHRQPLTRVKITSI